MFLRSSRFGICRTWPSWPWYTCFLSSLFYLNNIKVFLIFLLILPHRNNYMWGYFCLSNIKSFLFLLLWTTADLFAHYIIRPSLSCTLSHIGLYNFIIKVCLFFSLEPYYLNIFHVKLLLSSSLTSSSTEGNSGSSWTWTETGVPS